MAMQKSDCFTYAASFPPLSPPAASIPCALCVQKNGKRKRQRQQNAGVHSGDATLLLPAQKLWVETIRRVKRVASAICKALNISGPFNIQLMAKEQDIKVCLSFSPAVSIRGRASSRVLAQERPSNHMILWSHRFAMGHVLYHVLE